MGPNWKTTIIGVVAAVLNYFASLGANLPQTPEDWGHVLLSAALVGFGVLAKDFNVSNSPTPVAAKPVIDPPVDAPVAPKP